MSSSKDKSLTFLMTGKKPADTVMKAKREVLQGFQQQGSATMIQYLNIFLDADTNKDGLVKRTNLLLSFAATLPRAFGSDFSDSAIISKIKTDDWIIYNETLDGIVSHETFVKWDEFLEWLVLAGWLE